MVLKRDEAKQKLIDAAIECIEQYGIQNTTIRKIASQADVNSAAISYYFGSRDELIMEVLDATLDNAFQTDDIEIPDHYDYGQALWAILEHWHGGAMNYPGIVKAHFDIINSAEEHRDKMIRGLNRFIDEVAEILIKHGMPDTVNYRNKVRVIFSAVLNSVIMPEVMFGDGGKENAGEFMELLVSMLD